MKPWPESQLARPPTASNSPASHAPDHLALAESPWTGSEASDAVAPPSKSQRKREATALQGLGEHLVGLTAAQLRPLPLPDELRAAVAMAQTITQRGGHKRQLQYIGKLMRRLESSEIVALCAALHLPPPTGRG